MGTNGINNLRIGTPVETVRGLVDNIKNRNIRDIVINYCETDHDKIITDELELKLLNDYFTEEIDIKMPVYKKENVLERTLSDIKSVFGGEDRSRKWSGTIGEGDTYVAIYTDEYGDNGSPTGRSTLTMLYDFNNDNIADKYESRIMEKNSKKWEFTSIILKSTTSNFYNQVPDSMKKFVK